MLVMASFFNEQEQALLDSVDVKQHVNALQLALDRFKGDSVQDLLWEGISRLDETDDSDTKEQGQAPSQDDEKGNIGNAGKHESRDLSMIIEFDEGTELLCPEGHHHLSSVCMWSWPSSVSTAGLDTEDELFAVDEDNLLCRQCHAGDAEEIDEDDEEMCDLMVCKQCDGTNEILFCTSCLRKNVIRIKHAFRMNNIKSELIRNALKKQPWLSLDIMTALPRKKALEKLLRDIKSSGPDKSKCFALFLIDIDDLKALNRYSYHDDLLICEQR